MLGSLLYEQHEALLVFLSAAQPDEPPSFAHAGVIPDGLPPVFPAEGRAFVLAEQPPETGHFAHSGVPPFVAAPEDAEVERQAIVTAEPLSVPQAFTHSTFLAADVEPVAPVAVLDAEPLHVLPSFVHSTFLAVGIPPNLLPEELQRHVFTEEQYRNDDGNGWARNWNSG